MATTYSQSGLVVLGVNCYNEPKSGVAEFAREQRLSHTLLLNGKPVALRYGLTGIPATFWIDAGGIIRASETGFNLSALESHTRRLVEGGDARRGSGGS